MRRSGAASSTTSRRRRVTAHAWREMRADSVQGAGGQMNPCSMLDGSRPARWLRAVALALALGAAPFSGAQPATNDLDSIRQRAQAGDAKAQYLLADKLHR